MILFFSKMGSSPFFFGFFFSISRSLELAFVSSIDTNIFLIKTLGDRSTNSSLTLTWSNTYSTNFTKNTKKRKISMRISKENSSSLFAELRGQINIEYAIV